MTRVRTIMPDGRIFRDPEVWINRSTALQVFDATSMRSSRQWTHFCDSISDTAKGARGSRISYFVYVLVIWS